MEHVQYEFPFTRQGALQAYNRDQMIHMNSLYREFVRNSDMTHSERLYRQWVEVYVDHNAKSWENEHRVPQSSLVEYNNDKVLQRWNANPLFKRTIDDYMRG